MTDPLAETTNEDAPASTDVETAGNAIDLLTDDADTAKISAFLNQLYGSVQQIEKLRDWIESPMSSGTRRGVALWALGRHADALPLLEAEPSNPAIVSCLIKSHVELGQFDKALSLLKGTETEIHASAFMSVLEAQRDIDAFAEGLAKVESGLSPADLSYYKGRLKEFQRDPEGAIALYDQALSHEENHTQALLRLAVNVDLRGEDEEARELYERALLTPPVNIACVLNLGILYEDMGNYRRAMQCFDLILQTDPEHQRARIYRRDAVAALNQYYDEDQERREDKRNKIMRTPINDFELSVRSRNCLAKMNIRTLGDLVKKTEAELLSYKNFGETSLTEIKEILTQKNLRLGMGSEDLISKDFGDAAEPAVLTEEMPDPDSPDPLKRPISELDLSVRSRRIVDLLKIRTIGDLAHKTEAELLSCPNFGQTSLNEIKTKLDELGVALRS